MASKLSTRARRVLAARQMQAIESHEDKRARKNALRLRLPWWWHPYVFMVAGGALMATLFQSIHPTSYEFIEYAVPWMIGIRVVFMGLYPHVLKPEPKKPVIDSCSHSHTVPVTLEFDPSHEEVARICLRCLKELPPLPKVEKETVRATPEQMRPIDAMIELARRVEKFAEVSTEERRAIILDYNVAVENVLLQQRIDGHLAELKRLEREAERGPFEVTAISDSTRHFLGGNGGSHFYPSIFNGVTTYWTESMRSMTGVPPARQEDDNGQG